MSAITTVFFDWGGVIAGEPGDDFWTNLIKSMGASDSQADEIYDTYMDRFMRGLISEEDCWNELRQKYKLTITDNASEEFKKWKGLIVDESMISLIGRVKAAGFQVALLTNVIEPTYRALSQAGNYDYFDEIIASCKVGYAKPQREIYDIALDNLHTTAEQSLFIDDRQINLDTATTMGFTTILAMSPEQIIKDVARSLSL